MSEIARLNPDGPRGDQPMGYSQVVRVRNPGSLIYLAGQAALTPRLELIGAGDIEAQARATFRNIERNLAAAGASFADVVSMTVYLVDIRAHQWAVRKVRAEFIDPQAAPVSTMVQVSQLAFDGMLIEVQVLAVQ